jgi:DNA-binding PadR family transcriptional regulator
MDTISNKETALLGLLSEKPMHAYEIETNIKERGMRDWTEISMSSVYKLLKKLEEKSLVTSSVALSKNNVAQKTYTLSKEGKDAVREKIKALLSEPEKTIYRVDLASSNLRLLTKKEALSCLDGYEKKLIEGIKCYKELEKYLLSCSCPGYRMALAKRPQHLLKAELQWVREYRKEVEKGTGSAIA